ncbi:extracellular matrix organizing protein FRAS1-like [Amphiura filiformis]|uniref:extracellular matrix organizing protein FRAS1-like n=1 Tax=Amphiura filiformis TaxID=82378 RepID=UPI003B227499
MMVRKSIVKTFILLSSISLHTLLDTEIAFGDSSYSVRESDSELTVSVIRRGNLNEVVSFDVVSSNGNADDVLNIGDYFRVSRTVIFGVGEKEFSFLISIRDDTVVESMESFHLNLVNFNGPMPVIPGQPNMAEIFIEDTDVNYRFERAFYTTYEGDTEAVLTIVRDGFLGQSSKIGVYTEDVTAISSGPDRDYVPLLQQFNEMVTFDRDQTLAELVIDIENDIVFESPESFRVFLRSDIQNELLVPITAEVVIMSDGDNCTLVCQNGGFCISNTECRCPESFTGEFCEDDVDECLLSPPVCKGPAQCINKNGTYECVCNDPVNFELQGNRCVAITTQAVSGVFYAYQYDGAPFNFNPELLDSTSDEYQKWTSIIDPILDSIFSGLPGYRGTGVTEFSAFGPNVAVYYDVILLARVFLDSSQVTSTDISKLFNQNVDENGYIAKSPLRLLPIAGSCRQLDDL